MPDAFDRLNPGTNTAVASSSDAFDRLNPTAQASSDAFDRLNPSSPVPNQDKTASLPTPPPTSLAEKAKAALALGIAAGRMLPSGFGFGVQPNARQQVAEGVNNIVDFAGHKAVDAANYVATHGGFRPGGYDQPPFKYGQPMVQLAEPLTPEEEQSMPAPVAGVYGAVGEAANSLTTPEMVATLPAMALRPVLGAMALQGGVNLPEQVDQTAQTIGDPNQPSVEKWKAGARLGLNVGMTGLMGAGALRGAPKPPVLPQFKGDIFDRLNPTPPPTEQPSTPTPNAVQVEEAANVPTDQPTSDIPQVETGVRPQDQGQGTGGQGDEASQVVDFQHELNNVATLLNGHKAKLTPDLFDSLTAQGDEAFNTAQTDLPAAREAVARLRDQLRQAVSSPNTQTQGAPGADVVNPESGAQKPAASALGGLTREGLDKEELQRLLAAETGQEESPLRDVPVEQRGAAGGNLGMNAMFDPANWGFNKGNELRLTPDNQGMYNGEQLVNTLRNKLHPDEWAVLKEAGVEKALGGDRKVGVEEASKWLQENGPKVEVRKFGEEQASPLKREFNLIQHEVIDRLGLTPTFRGANEFVGWKDRQGQIIHAADYRPEDYTRLQRWVELRPQVEGLSVDQSHSHWSSVAPKAEKDMPGYVEIAVVKPIDDAGKQTRDNLTKPGSGRGIQFPESHSFPPNTLAFARGYMETTKDGKKVFHVIEVQSDWAQHIRELKGQQAAEGGMTDKWIAHKSDPLLQHYERLALKAVINHARKEGADSIAISDAETAMMTEGHDRAKQVMINPTEHNKRIALQNYNQLREQPSGESRYSYHLQKLQDLIYKDVPVDASALKHDLALGYDKTETVTQEPGMRLHYDRTLPKIAEELTGSKGQRVEFGEHKMAFEHDHMQSNPALEPRKDLIFRNTDNTPKTSISALTYPLNKARSQFTLFGKDRPVPNWDATTQSKGGIGAGMRAAIEKNRESGGIMNLVKRNPAGASSALATTGVMDDVTFGSRVARVGTALTGTTFPKHAEVSEKATNALAAYGVARDAAPVMGEHMATDVLGPKWKDQNFNKLLDAVIVQDQLANLKAQHVAKGDAAMAARVKDVWNMPGSPLRDEAQYRALLKNPDVIAAIARHKATIQPFAEMMHVELGGKLREGGKETGAFTNLVAILNPEDVESVKDMIYGSRRGNLTNPFKRGSAFTKQAKGTAQSYQFDYRKTAERMIRGNYEQYTLQKYYKTMEAEGLGFEAQAGGKAPVTASGRPLKKVEIVRKGTGPGVTYRKNFWIRPDLHPELMRALGTDQKPVSGVTSVLLDAATDLQIIGPMDLLSHTANMFGTVASSPGGRGVLYDAVRLNTPVGLVDTAFRLGYNFLQALHNSPEVQKHIADYTQIGAGRAKPVHRGGLLSKPVAYVTGLPLETVQKFDPFHYANQFTAGLLKNVDKAGRLTLNKMFDELVSRGWEKPSDLNRREFINRMGQYNSRLMPYYQQWMRERGLSPFVVAGVTMNRNALFRLIGNPQIRGANPQAWAKMVSVTALGTLSMVYAMPMVLNQLTVGNWKGRPGTQIGQIDTGKNDKQGRPIVVDPLQLLLLRRGLRISGINAIDRGQKEDLGAKRTAKEVIKDISAGILHPWIGPAPRFLYHAAAGREPAIPTQEGFMLSKNPHDPAENLVAALKHANPTLSSIFKGQEEGTGAVQEPIWNVLNPMGVKRGRLPSWSEKTTAAIVELAKTDPSLSGKTSIDQLSIGQRAKLQRLMNTQKTPASDYAMRAGAEKNLWENFAKQDTLKGALKPDQQKWLADKKLTLSGFEAEITRGGTRLPATRQEGEFMQQAVAQEYQKAIEKLMQSPRNITQKILDERLTQARLRARAQLTRQMRASAVPK